MHQKCPNNDIYIQNDGVATSPLGPIIAGNSLVELENMPLPKLD